MDKTDERLLEILRGDARESFVSIAKKLKTSEGTVRARVKRLVRQGIIRGFTIRTSGKDVKGFIEVKVDSNVHTSDIAGRIRGLKGVEGVFEVSGETDIIAFVDVLSTAELNEVIESIRRLDNALSTRTRLVLKEH